MKCDKCGKEMGVKDRIVDAILVEFEPAVLLQIPQVEEAEATLGKYFNSKTNVNGILTWAFCYECVLDSLFNTSQATPAGDNGS